MTIEGQSPELAAFNSKLCQDLYGRQQDGKTCVKCNKPPVAGQNMHSEAGWREFQISGLCESCFDAAFEE